MHKDKDLSPVQALQAVGQPKGNTHIHSHAHLHTNSTRKPQCKHTHKQKKLSSLDSRAKLQSVEVERGARRGCKQEKRVKEKDHGRHSDPKPASADRMSATARQRHRGQTQTQEERTQPEGQGQTFYFIQIYRLSQTL